MESPRPEEAATPRQASANGYVSRYEMNLIVAEQERMRRDIERIDAGESRGVAVITAKLDALAEAVRTHTRKHDEDEDEQEAFRRGVTESKRFRTELLVSWAAVIVALGTMVAYLLARLGGPNR